MRENDILGPRLADIAVAFALLTRLPLPRLPDPAFAHQARAGWAFGLVGAGLALIAGLVGMAAIRLGLPPIVAAGLMLATQIVLTGAMHEDGLADTADGLWGGWTRERRLEIMKDSAIGSYGVLALILSVGLRWVALAELIDIGAGIGALVTAAALSRALLPGLMSALPPARGDGLSHRVGSPGRAVSLAALALGLGVATLGIGATALTALAFAALAVTALALLARARIGGQTGDILGAAQQIAEITVLLVLLTR